MQSFNRDTLESLAMGCVAADEENALYESLSEKSDAELLALIQQGDPSTQCFLASDGYLFVKHDGVWTDGDLTFGDLGGRPYDQDMQEPLEGRFVAPDEDQDRYTAIMESLPRSNDEISERVRGVIEMLQKAQQASWGLELATDSFNLKLDSFSVHDTVRSDDDIVLTLDLTIDEGVEDVFAFSVSDIAEARVTPDCDRLIIVDAGGEPVTLTFPPGIDAKWDLPVQYNEASAREEMKAFVQDHVAHFKALPLEFE
ncbi:hypothetical protein, partial [Marinobacterium sp. BA1]|uniref:hypothetical protein n=1 Tax=Marinobacterium sp. BA1 TaxID=3138931 RepID=UPI0034E8D225